MRALSLLATLIVLVTLAASNLSASDPQPSQAIEKACPADAKKACEAGKKDCPADAKKACAVDGKKACATDAKKKDCAKQCPMAAAKAAVASEEEQSE
jgi:hypothetical protein